MLKIITIKERAWWFMPFVICLAAIGGNSALADPGGATKYVLPDGRIVYSDKSIPGGKPVKELGQVPDAGTPPASRLTPFEQNATLPEVAGTDRIDLVKDRLARGADPNAPDKVRRVTPLQAAAGSGRVEIVNLLLRAGADPKLVPPRSNERSPLCEAASGKLPGHTEVTRMLLKNGARANDKCVMGYGPTPLMLASEAGNAETVKALLAAGADANAVDWAPNEFPRRDTTALMYAAREGHAEAVKLLLGAGANVNAKMLPYGWTALWLAANGRYAGTKARQRDYADIARALLQSGAKVSAAPSSDPRTPLLVAAKANSADFVKVLLEFGASPNDHDQEGQTPLMHAAKRGDAGMVSVLLAKGADPGATDRDGRTALQLANMLGFPEVARLLAEPSTTEPRSTGAQRQEVPKQIDAEPRTLSALWQFEAPSGISRGPFLAENVVFVGAWNGLVYALNAATGRQLWTHQTKGIITAPPSVLDGVLYFGGVEGQSRAGNGTVYALELGTGKHIWSRSFSTAIQHLVISGSMLFIQTVDGELHSVNLRSGRTVWQANLGPGNDARPLVIGNTIVAGTRGLRGLDMQTGREKWQLSASRLDPKAVRFKEYILKTLPAGKARGGARSMTEDVLYVYGIGVCESLAEGRTLRALQDNMAEFFGPEFARALTQAARAEICPPGTAPEQIAAAAKAAQDGAEGGARVATAPVADGMGNVFIQLGTTAPDRVVVGIDAQSGKRVFAASLAGYGINAPVVGASSLFLYDGNNLLAFDLATQARLWSLDLQSQARPNPMTVFHEGLLLIAGNTLLVVDARTGAVSWRAGSGLQAAKLLGVADGVAYCRSQNYYGVDVRTGVVLWTTSGRGDLLGTMSRDITYSKNMFFHAHGNYVFGVRTVGRGDASH